MTVEKQDVIADSSAASSEDVNLTESTSSDSSTVTETKKDDGLVPRERLNEEIGKRKQAEQDKALFEKRVREIEQAIKGSSTSEVRSSKAELASRWNVPQDFVEDLIKSISSELKSNSQPDPIALEAHAEIRFAQELDDLETELPEASEMTREEKKQLKKLRFSPEFIRTPLKSVFRDMMYGKKTSKDSFETSRAGGRVAEADDGKTFKGGSLEEARKFFEKNTKKRGHR